MKQCSCDTLSLLLCTSFFESLLSLSVLGSAQGGFSSVIFLQFVSGDWRGPPAPCSAHSKASRLALVSPFTPTESSRPL